MSFLQNEIRVMVGSWKRFCERVPFSKKEKFVFREYGHNDAGYEYKPPTTQLADTKENFHVNMAQLNRLKQVSKRHLKRYPEFIVKIPDIIDQLEPLIVEHVDQIEEEEGIRGLVREVMNGRSYWTIRYLHYYNQDQSNPDQPLAKAHIDKCGITLHLYESSPGLQFLCPDTRVWHPISTGTGYIMNGAQMQLRTYNGTKADVHRVINVNDKNNNKENSKGRYAMVFFVPLIHTAIYNKAKYGNMQSHEPGFNYEITFEEYSKYFM